MDFTWVAIATLGLAILSWVFVICDRAWKLHKDPGLCVWPRITHCRVCNKPVYAWQRHERRNFAVELDNPDKLAVSITTASGIVHSACKGVPVFKAGVRLVH
ncbi:MAG TPA: hypothetical protein PLR75_02120 [Candidatus Pacearchaeota archaeon]|nr:hypothetical protein [Candidatus Pacearchaeota archaeon]